MSLNLTIPFTDETNYTFDSTLVEISGGVGKLKDLRPPDSILYAEYSTAIDLDWGSGAMTGTPVNGAAITSGKLDLTGGVVKYVDYNADNITPFNLNQTYAIRLRVTPDYTGAPPANIAIFSMSTGSGSTQGLIGLTHLSSGDLRLNCFDESAAIIYNLDVAFSPTLGVEVEIEINTNLNTGLNSVYVDGVLAGSNTVTGTRSVVFGLFRVGGNSAGTAVTDISLRNFLVFDEPQHTSNYIPDWTNIFPTIYATSDPTVQVNAPLLTDGLTEFTETSIKPTSEIKYILKKNLNWFYHDGANWVVSNQTYAQSNTAVEINTNITTFTTTQVTVTIRVFLHSNIGDTTPEIDQLVICYSFGGDIQDILEYCTVWGYQFNASGDVDQTPFEVRSGALVTKYKNNIIDIYTKITVTPTITGYYEFTVVENENMSAIYSNEAPRYIVRMKSQDYSILVPNTVTAKLNDLIDP